MKVTHILRRHAHEAWAANISHPFVQGIGNGSLDKRRFTFYLAQDYVYLKDFVRFLAVGLGKGPTVDAMTMLSDLIQLTLKVEMDLHRSICTDSGVGPMELDQIEPAPHCLGYTSYLLRIAYEGDFLDFLAAFLPCEWSYVEIGRRLKKRGLPQDQHYAEWIKTYASQPFWDLTQSIKDRLDDLARGASSQKMERLQEVFGRCVAWECVFWDMAWNLQTWIGDGACNDRRSKGG
jgi:thiaminase/transcriptional activator TenA